MIHLRVFGTPASQGSKRWLPNGRMIEADKKVRPWRHAVYAAVQHDAPDLTTIDGPVSVRVTFMFERPKAHYRTGRNAGMLRDGAPEFVTRTPDIDKVVRATLDPLTEVGVWRDDAQVVMLHARKRYCSPEERPGAVIDIEPLLL